MSVNPSDTSAAKTGLLKRLRNLFSKNEESGFTRPMPFSSIHLSQTLKLNKVQRQGLSECIEALQQLIRFPGSDTRREHSAVIHYENFDLLPATDSSVDRLQRATDMLTRFNDWFATLDDAQQQRFQEFLRQRRGAV